MKKLILVLFCLIPFFIKAQTGWVQARRGIEGSDFLNGFGGLLTTGPDGNVISCGFFSDGDGGFESVIYVTKFDEYGNTLWGTVIDYDSTLYGSVLIPSSIVNTPDGGFLISCFDDFDEDLWVVKLDAYGNEIWETDSYVDELDPGWIDNYLTYEISTDSIAWVYFQTGSNEGSFYTEIFNPDGEIIEDVGITPLYEYFGIPYDSIEFRMVKSTHTSDNGFILGGWIDFASDTSRFFLYKHDEYMQAQWAQIYEIPVNFEFINVKENYDGTYLIIGETDYDPSPDSVFTYLSKVDDSGNVIWFRKLTSAYQNTFALDVCVRTDENINVLCEYYGIEEELDDTANSTLFTFDLDGNAIATQELNLCDMAIDSIQEDYSSMIALPDNSVAITGTLEHYQIGFLDDAYMVTIKSFPGGALMECVFNCVWPGDADNSGIADMDDLLALGLGYGETGAARIDNTIDWYGHDADAWIDSLPDGTNLKYTDCNGDGIINAVDTSAIALNYNANHPIVELRLTGGDPELYFDPAIPILPLGPVDIPIMLGDELNPVELSGIRFSVTFDGFEIIDSTAMEINFDDCWMGTPPELLTMQKTFPEIKTIDAGITRIDHTNVTGYGQIGTLGIIVIDNIAGKIISSELTINIINVRAIKNNGEEIPLSQSSYTFTLLSAIPKENTQQFILYPNPVFDNEFSIILPENAIADQLIITDLTGREVYSTKENISSGTTIKIPELEQGEYIVKLISQTGIYTQKLFVVQ
ncbi:MAG: T9SS type A sorting domain-containing protein [Chitinophagales bacterium]